MRRVPRAAALRNNVSVIVVLVNEHEAAVRSTGRKVSRHDQEVADHLAAVFAALKAGERPTDVATWSPYSATYLRRLAREAGVPAPPRGGRRKPRVRPAHADS